MPWFKVDDKLHSHPKVIDAGNEAMGLWVRLGSWCADHLTDGVVPDKVIDQFMGHSDELNRLIDAGLLVDAGGNSYRLHDFGDYNPSAKAVLKVRKERAKAGRKGGSKRQAKPKQTPSKDGSETEAKSNPVPVPDPIVTPPLSGHPPKPPKGGRRRKKNLPEVPMPADWQPTDNHRAFAQKHGIDLEIEVYKFKGHYDGQRCASWNGRFATWLGQQVTYAKRDAKKADPQAEIPVVRPFRAASPVPPRKVGP